jgi:hypothetical protein
VPQHGGLGRTRGAAAEVERRKLFAVAIRQRLRGRALQQRLIVRGRLSAAVAADGNNVSEAFDFVGQPADLLRERPMRDQRARARVAQHRRQVRTGQPRIERHPHKAGRHGAVVDLEILAHIRDEQRDPVAAVQGKPAQRIPEPHHPSVKVPIGPCPGIIDDRGTTGILLREGAPLSADMHVPAPATSLAARPAR